MPSRPPRWWQPAFGHAAVLLSALHGHLRVSMTSDGVPRVRPYLSGHVRRAWSAGEDRPARRSREGGSAGVDAVFDTFERCAQFDHTVRVLAPTTSQSLSKRRVTVDGWVRPFMPGACACADVNVLVCDWLTRLGLSCEMLAQGGALNTPGLAIELVAAQLACDQPCTDGGHSTPTSSAPLRLSPAWWPRWERPRPHPEEHPSPAAERDSNSRGCTRPWAIISAEVI
jgi:hypothetical protein